MSWFHSPPSPISYTLSTATHEDLKEHRLPVIILGEGDVKVLGIVTARGGSKGIPGKNLAEVAGRSLLEWTARAARGSERLTRVVLSTDDAAIAKAGVRCGLEVPFMRPAHLAQDSTPTLPVLQHVVAELAASDQHFDAVFILQPTHPLRRPADIDGAIQMLEETGADSVISFTPVGDAHPARMKRVDTEGRVHDPSFAEAFEGQRRQDLPPLLLREGSVYVTRTEVLMEHHSIKGSDCRAWVVARERACNIDEPFDLWLAEQLLRKQTEHP